MYDNDSKGISYTAGFFILISFAIVGVLIASAISIPLWVSMTGRPILEMEKDLSNPAYSNAAKVLQSITAIVGFFIPTLVTAFLLSRQPKKLLGFSRRIKWSQAGLVIVIIIAALFVSTALSWFTEFIPLPASTKEWFDKLENDYNKQVEAIIGLNNPTEYILALVVMAFIPALCEETLFRGGLQNFLTRATRMPWLSIVIVSFIFSIVHLSYYGFLSRFFLGVILGVVYHYSGRLWLSILAHFINNALAITMLYISRMDGKSFDKAINDTPDTFWGILALPAVVALIMVFRRVSFNTQNS